jgi:cytochrome P450
LKFISLGAAPRYYPALEFLLKKFMPRSVIEGQQKYIQYASEKINRRIDLKSERPDFMTPFMKNNVNFKNVSRDEIIATFSFVIVGGSELSATTMTGMFNLLSKRENRGVLERLTEEIRGRFKVDEEVTFDSIQSLPYLDAVINGGLRLCNPVPGGLPRMVPAGGDSYCGIYLPEGVSNHFQFWTPFILTYQTRLAVRTFVVNRSEKLFANPDSFVPERWLSDGDCPK